MDFRISNKNHIKKLLLSHPDNIKEIIFDVKDIDVFLDNILDSMNEDSDWPLAVNPSLIVDMNNLDECRIRSSNILDMIVETDLYGLNILDFGCGNGLTAVEMLARGAKKVVGYDLQRHPFWENVNGLHMTTVAQEVAANGPYDFILLYDVLDHIVNTDPVGVLKDLNILLATEGIITMRNHPWIARHGTHLYTSFNRAFAHLIFDEKKLAKRGYTSTPVRKIVHPVMTYKKWFEKAELKIIKEDKIIEPVESYFTDNDLLKTLIWRHFEDSPLHDYQEKRGDLGRILSFHFVDYIVKKA